MLLLFDYNLCMLYRRATVGSDVLKDATPDAAPSSVTRYSRNINEHIKW